MATIRAGFPVVATHAGAAAGYSFTTPAFSANAGDELTVIACCAGLPEPVARNSTDTGAGTLNWIRRFVTRGDHQDSSTNRAGAFQTAYYTAIVPPGGVTECVRLTTPFLANDGGQPTFPDNLPAQLVVIAVDDTNGVGAIAWRGSSSAGTGGSNDITTGLAATHVIKPMGASSLIIGGGWIVNGGTITDASGCTPIVAPGTLRMPVWTKTGGSAGTDVVIGSGVTDSTLWALGAIEYLPLTTPKPTKKLFCFGDSGIESNLAARQTAVVVQDALAPNWELFNQGVYWSHTAQVLARWTADNAKFPTIDAAIVQVGINDIVDNGGGTTWPSASQTDLTSLYAALDGLGIPLACYTGVGPLATRGVAPAGYYDMLDWITANAPAGSHFYSTDLVADPAAAYLAILSAYQAPDGNHIDAAGNAITGANIASWITSLTPITVDQEGFRFGFDDANESGHTFAQSQDTNDTTAVGTARLLRLILDSTGDPSTIPFKLRYQKNGTGGYLDVPVGGTTAAVYGTVTFGAIGTGANGGTTVAPQPASPPAGAYMVAVITSGATNSEIPTAPDGTWTLLATGASTDGTYGIDTGPRRVTAFGKVATGSEGTTAITFSITNGGTCRGTISHFTKSGSGSWVVDAVGSNDSTSGTGFSATGGSLNWNTGDATLVATGQRVDTATQSAQSLTATGVTFGARTNRAATAVTTGNDHRHSVDTFEAISSTSDVNAAPTWAYTASAACSGGVVFVRLREYTAAVTNEVFIDASSNITDGEATTARLTSPGSKTTSNFIAGKRADASNSLTVDLGTDQYTELEWRLNTQSPAANSDYYDFRVYNGATALDSYAVTPRLTLSSGGTSVNASITEAATASDSTSTSNVTSAAITEAVSAADTVSALNISSATTTEAVSTSESVGASGFKSAFSTEVTNTSENQSVINSTSISITESATTGSTQDAVGGGGGVIVEAATPTDTSTAQGASSTSISEPVTSNSSQSATYSTQAVASESTSTSDSSTTVSSQPTSITESATVSDTVSAGNLFPVYKTVPAIGSMPIGSGPITSSLRLELSAAASLSASVNEASSTTDSSSATASISAAVSEPATSANTSTATSASSTSSSESVTASETSSSVKSTPATISEGATANDSETGTVGTGGTSVIESASASESPSASNQASSAVTEPVSSSESSTGTNFSSGSAGVTESVSASNTQSSTNAATASVTEGPILSEVSEPGGTQLTSITESVALAEISANGSILSAAIQEGATCGESLTALSLISAAVSELVNANHDSATILAGVLAIVESINANSIQSSGQAILLASVVESANPNDVSLVLTLSSSSARVYSIGLENRTYDIPA